MPIVMMKFNLIVLILLLANLAIAQQDSLVFVNGDIILGECKGMTQGVLKLETDYSETDFEIEWSGVEFINTETYFLISLSDGTRYNGQLASIDDGLINIISNEDGVVSVELDDIVFLDSVDKGFWSQIYASIDVGLDMTKANNLRQLSTRSNLGYMAEHWSSDSYYNAIKTTQDSADVIQRNDAGIDFKYYFEKKWFGVASITFFSNTEQKIDLRTNGRLGLGSHFVQTNHAYWNYSLGASFNNERYEDADDNRDSWEAFVASELNMFDTGDINLTSKVGAYPSLTEKGRWRFDFTLDLKYDLPRDFYIKTGITYNYDSKPVSDTTKDDYVFYTGFGWEL